jgi:hypothetical protein
MDRMIKYHEATQLPIDATNYIYLNCQKVKFWSYQSVLDVNDAGRKYGV